MRISGAILMGVIMWAAVLVSTPGHAQPTKSTATAKQAITAPAITGLVLESPYKRNLIPYVAVYKDPRNVLTPASIVARLRQNDRPRPKQDNLIIADKKIPTWIAVPITNNTNQPLWSIDFGTRASGRTAQFVSLMVMDQTTGQVFFKEENRSAKSPTQLSSDHHVVVRLPKGVSSILIIRMITNDKTSATTPITLHPGMIPQPTYMWNALSWFCIVCGLIVAGGLFSISMLSQRYSVMFIGLYALFLPLVYFTPLSLLPTYFDHFIPAPNLYYIFVTALFTQATVTLTNLSGIRLPYLRLSMMIGGICACFVVATLLIPADITLTTYFRFLLMAPSIAICVLCAGLGLRDSDRFGVTLSILGILHVAGMTTQILSTGNVIPVTIMGISALPLAGLLIYAGLFIALQQVNVFNDVSEQQRKRKYNPRDEMALTNLRNAKENFDYSSLLKVIEHERKQLADARIRETVRSEEMRKAKDEADQANRAKSAFLAVISHEIRTPMTGVLGMVKLLTDTTLTKDQRDYVDTIKESGNAMMGLLNDILDFEKIESGKMQIEAIDFDLHRLIASVQTLMNGHATTKNLTLLANIGPNVPQYVIGDMLRLRQILLNLIGNAIKFTKVGSVTISVSKMDTTHVDVGPVVHQIYFSVSDTGIGISAEAQKNIFNPFSQADKTIARKFGGSGLGLAISKRLLEVMGSQINIKSRENVGTTFFFNLSMMQGDAAMVEEYEITAPAPDDKPQGIMTSLRILIVEDNVITQRVLRTLTEQYQHNVTIAGSGEEALPFLKMGERFDAIFTDVQMDGMNGYEFARAVRAMNNDYLRTVPIIALTGNIDDDDIAAAHEAGMTGHLAKPIDPEKFEKMLMDLSAQVRSAAKNTHDRSQKKSPTLPENAQMDILITLRESLGDAQLNELLSGLYAKTDEIIATLEKTDMDDLASIRDRAHELKGMCGNFGLSELSDLARDIEKQAKNDQTTGLDDLIKKLPATYARSRQMIDTWMKA